MSVPRPARRASPISPGAYLFRDGDGRVDLRGQGHVAPQAPGQLLGQAAAPPHRGHDRSRPRASSGSLASGEVDALMLEYNLIQTPPAAVQHPLPRRQVLPVPGAHRGGDAGRARRCCGAPSARRSATSAPTATRGPSATRSTPSPGSSRSAPARTRSSISGRARSGRACTSTSAAARGRACPRSRASPRSPTARTSTRMADFLAGNPKPVLARLEREMRRGVRAPGVRAGRQAARPARAPPAAPWRPRRWCSPSPRTST